MYDFNNTHFEREYFALHSENVLVMHYTANDTKQLNFTVHSEGVHADSSNEALTISGNVITLRG